MVVMVWGKVVENNIVWCLCGRVFKIFLMLLVKFMFNMWLVLLRIVVVIEDRCSCLCWRWLSICLGVLMMMWIFCCSVCVCGCIGLFFEIVSIWSFWCLWFSFWSFWVIWVYSFCVGYKINVCSWWWFSVSFFKMGRLNVVVLLLFVFDWLMRLWFLSRGGMVFVWIVVIFW